MKVPGHFPPSLSDNMGKKLQSWGNTVSFLFVCLSSGFGGEGGRWQRPRAKLKERNSTLCFTKAPLFVLFLMGDYLFYEKQILNCSLCINTTKKNCNPRGHP